MTVLELIHQLLIAPISLLLEAVYGVFYDLTDSVGGSIIPLSLTVNFLLLPFYVRADALQREEREMQERMASGLAHIRKAFRGDERYMMQQAYYRINHYRPVYAMKSALPLLLQIPFFIAAYQFLSHLKLFEGRPFFLILDLSQPDGLLEVGGLAINLLPILMTLINLLSSELYTKGLGMKDKLQLYGIALIFLVLLYHSPSGLVLYWTLNNLFSLAKNVISATKQPKLAAVLTLSGLGGLTLVYLATAFEGTELSMLILALIALLFQIPSLMYAVGKFFPEQTPAQVGAKEGPGLFLQGCWFLAAFAGLLIPSQVIRSSPSEFILVGEFLSPVWFALCAFLLGAGCFVFWLGLFYYLAEPRYRRGMEAGIWTLVGMSLVNFMFFGTNLGMLNPQLQFGKTPVFSTRELLINAEVCLAAATLVLVVWMKQRKLLKFAAPVLVLAVFGVSLVNLHSIQQEIPQIRAAVEAGQPAGHRIRLSRKKKNVVVFMLDCAVNSFVPYMFQEKPELEQQFDGFTWYPNTVSYGPATNTGSPGVFGGYEYIPEEMNRRSELSLREKQNEALKLMPVTFLNAGYQVTVCDPTYANYQWIPDVSIYDDYPDIVAFNTEYGQMNVEYTENTEQQIQVWKRNFFCYSVMKTSPLIAQMIIYQDGAYYNPSRYGDYLLRVQIPQGTSKAEGISTTFLDHYTALDALPNLTQIGTSNKGSFFMMSNSTPHDLSMLQEPEYEPALAVDNTTYDEEHTERFTINGRTMKANNWEIMEAYQINMAALLKLGEWFDYLRSEGVYDNTRIIIVADHGRSLGCFEDLLFGTKDYQDVMRYNPILLVKDFDSHGFSRDDQFMTNADTPTLAFSELIADPINPFTGNAVTDETKREEVQHLFFTQEWQTTVNNGNTYMPGTWIHLSNHDIFDISNWKVIEEN